MICPGGKLKDFTLHIRQQKRGSESEGKIFLSLELLGPLLRDIEFATGTKVFFSRGVFSRFPQW
jgi:hypothetical protein